MKAKLVRFRVMNFRSVRDSGWIDVDRLTCLVGTNESGKSNILLGLTKLKPASGDLIVPLQDYPRSEYPLYKTEGMQRVFISAEFDLGNSAGEGLAEGRILIQRKFNGTYSVFKGERLDEIHLENQHEAEIRKQPWWDLVPSFLYYSEYGNLDSSIYLPEAVRLIDSLKGAQGIADKQHAKARTLKVLFDTTGLVPKEILSLGKETNQQFNQAIEDSKKEREILLTAASSKLSKAFKEWWQQGSFKFRFQADGDYFKIWVSDDVRPEEIELEGRSRGLLWFFSFFIVFLAESKAQHSNTVLLLDEPGLTLHPIAQRDLIRFFTSLSEQNQLIYTTHSPFMVDPDKLGDVFAVYVGSGGDTQTSSDLRKGNPQADKSIYAVHSAIGLTVSDTLLLGCRPVLVEGISDQIYLTAIKNHLTSLGKFKFGRELVFIPTGGAKGVTAVKNIITGLKDDLPFVVLDSDKPGDEMAKNLLNGSYREAKNRVIQTKHLVKGMEHSEVEDLFPANLLAKCFDRMYHFPDGDFGDMIQQNVPIVNQMDTFLAQNQVNKVEGWKVELAKECAKRIRENASIIPEDVVKTWESLFGLITG